MVDSQNAAALPKFNTAHPIDTFLASITGIEGVLNLVTNDFDENLSGGPGFVSSERSIYDALNLCHRLAMEARAALDSLLDDYEIVRLTDAEKRAHVESLDRIRRKAADPEPPRMGVGVPRAG